MVVVGCCVVPSWPGVLDLDLPDLPDSAQQLHVAAKYIGDHVADLKPDIIGDGWGAVVGGEGEDQSGPLSLVQISRYCDWFNLTMLFFAIKTQLKARCVFMT